MILKNTKQLIFSVITLLLIFNGSFLYAAVNDGRYSLFILPTPVDSATGAADYGVDGAWNSGLSLFGRPDAGGFFIPMTDSDISVTLSTGEVIGSSIFGDGYAGAIEIEVQAGVFFVNSFSVDGLDTILLGMMAQQSRVGNPTQMHGSIDAYGQMLFQPEQREAALADGAESGAWNVNDVTGSAEWVALTTGTTANTLGLLTGSPFVEIGDINGDGLIDYEGVLVSASELGSDWGGLTSLPYYEMWRVHLLSAEPCFPYALDTICTADLSLDVLENNDPLELGQVLQYDFSVANWGSGPAEGSSLIVSFTTATDPVINSISTTQGSCSINNITALHSQFSCNFGTINVNQSVSVSLSLTPSQTGNVSLEAEVVTYTDEYEYYNNYWYETTQVIQDNDKDGSPSDVDCNDNDAGIYPGATEITLDGVDQDCNGYDLTISVLKAEYNTKRKLLSVSASSQLNADANLSVTGYGMMSYHKGKRIWELTVNDIAMAPDSLTISGIEGVLTTAVVIK